MNTIFSALAEPHRLHMVELLRDGPLTVGEIVDRLGLSQPQVSKHLRVLSEAGLVEVQPIANRRVYKLRPQSLQDIENWLGSFRRLWETRFDRMEAYIEALQVKETKPADPK
ncbi:metalloregulator ArsR/SmtB family transcription factor [Paenibacillus sp. LMG 31461]|uniref:Metalloregulator ArsR/SmtB family transcription factor n=1 Tax=Paenibacillus plantarum TaxID=2654975 RepID=A0ABX1XER4_9BACL|nr:metalloregulator ArsR/SmtB family transcription factor [Paenibacillus plantarum]NOU66439.1 metalloregulator ArsR/SmtB family transcription factor [Paenibacillus plantarum]